MARALPPLNSLRAFEAAARRLSFTRAAEELGVTQAAISHQIKLLEAELGFRLFRRLNNTLVLTEKGETYLPSVRQAFDLLCEATGALHGGDSTEVLTLSVLPNFALRWLVPRLAGFQNLYPAVDIRLLTSYYRSTDFLREDIDAAIRLGGDWPNLNADHLFGSDMFPVCSPALLAREPLNTVRDLSRHRLLHVFSLDDWAVWLKAAGAPDLATERGPTFDSYALAMEAAAFGCGVAMARGAFLLDELTGGRLVMPFRLRVNRSAAWYFLWPKARTSRKVSLFRSWLLAQAAQMPRLEEHRAAALP